MFVADLYLTLSYFVSFVHDYCDKLTNYRAIIQTYRAIIFKFSHLSRDNCNLSRHKFELSRENLMQCPLRATVVGIIKRKRIYFH